MYKRLIYFIEKNKILSDNQFGFTSSHSTVQTITLITDKIVKGIEENYYCCGIFLDLSKAFDTVSHDILLLKNLNIMVYVVLQMTNLNPIFVIESNFSQLVVLNLYLIL